MNKLYVDGTGSDGDDTGSGEPPKKPPTKP